MLNNNIVLRMCLLIAHVGILLYISRAVSFPKNQASHAFIVPDLSQNAANPDVLDVPYISSDLCVWYSLYTIHASVVNKFIVHPPVQISSQLQEVRRTLLRIQFHILRECHQLTPIQIMKIHWKPIYILLQVPSASYWTHYVQCLDGYQQQKQFCGERYIQTTFHIFFIPQWWRTDRWSLSKVLTVLTPSVRVSAWWQQFEKSCCSSLSQSKAWRKSISRNNLKETDQTRLPYLGSTITRQITWSS